MYGDAQCKTCYVLVNPNPPFFQIGYGVIRTWWARVLSCLQTSCSRTHGVLNQQKNLRVIWKVRTIPFLHYQVHYLPVFRIRIGSGFNQVSGSRFWIWIRGSRGTKMTRKDRKKVKKFHVVKCWMFSFDEGFSCSLDVLYGGLGISKLQFLIKKI
jgi:hypothetical protein